MADRTTMDMAAFRRAAEQSNADQLRSFYTDNAQMKIVDRTHPPSAPLVLSGNQVIGDYLADICRREMSHLIEDEVVGEGRIAFNEACQYPGGERVLASSILELQNGKIVRQVTVQAWDE